MTGTFELDGKQIPYTIGDGATADDLDDMIQQHIAAGASPPPETAPAPDTVGTGRPWGHLVADLEGRALDAADYVTQRAKEWGTAATNLGSVLSSDPVTGDADVAGKALDALTVTAPVLAPEATLLGVGAGAVTQGITGSPAWARAADIAASLGTGVYQAYQAIQAAGGVGATIDAVKKQLGVLAPKTVGENIQADFPAVEESIRTGVQASTYDAAKAEMAARGAQIDVPPAPAQPSGLLNAQGQPITPPASSFTLDPIGQKLLDDLTAAKDKWGAVSSSPERDAAENLIKRLTEASDGKPITYADLDQQYLNLQKVGYGQASSVRAAIDSAMDALAKGTPAEAMRAAGKAAWGTNVPGQTSVAAAKELRGMVTDSLTGVADPVGLFNKISGSFTNPAKATAFRDTVGVNSQLWKDMVGGFWGRLFEAGANDPARVAARFERLPQSVKDLYDPAGEAAAAFKKLAITGRGEPYGKAARVAVAGTMGLAAIDEFRKGNWVHGAELLGLAALGEATPAAEKVGTYIATVAPGIGPATRAAAATLGGPVAGIGAPENQPAEGPAPSSGASDGTPAAPPSTSATTTSTTSTTLPPAQQQSDTRPYANEFATAAKIAKIPVALMHAVADQETQGRDPTAVSPQGAVGVMQIMPDTFKKYAPEVRAITGHDPDIYDPVDNIVAGALHLRDDLKASRTGAFGAALRYHGGPDPRQWGQKTIDYAHRVANALGQSGVGG